MEIAKELTIGKWFGEGVDPLKPEEIGILYRSGKGTRWNLLARLRDQLEASGIPTVWLTENLDARHRIGEKAAKVTTIHASKGLQYRAVILLFAGECPETANGETEPEERRLFYVALTRAEDYLVVTWSKKSLFVSEMTQAGKVREV